MIFKQIFAKISIAYICSIVTYATVRRWKKKFESGLELIKNAPKSGRPKPAFCGKIIPKVEEIVERDARYTVRDIARMVGISLSRDYCILKNILYVRKISTRWMPHLSTDCQKMQRNKIAKLLLKYLEI